MKRPAVNVRVLCGRSFETLPATDVSFLFAELIPGQVNLYVGVRGFVSHYQRNPDTTASKSRSVHGIRIALQAPWNTSNELTRNSPQELSRFSPSLSVSLRKTLHDGRQKTWTPSLHEEG